MTNVFTKQLLISLLLLATHCATAQVRFVASISPGQINKNAYAQLKFSVENANDVQDIIPPQLNDFIVISGPNQESGMSNINGDIKKYVAITYVIKPKGPGNFSFPPATAHVDGATYHSNSLILKVNNATSGNNPGSNVPASPFALVDPFIDMAPRLNYTDFILKKGENVLDKINRNMFVTISADKHSCFVGEPVIVEYKLYTRLKSESSLTKSPSFNGFSVIDLLEPENQNYKIEKLNGKEYNVYTIRKAQLYPLQSGNLEFEAAEVDNTVHFIKEEYARSQMAGFEDMFQDFSNAGIPAEGMEDHTVTIKSKPLGILIKPLPDLNKPANFKGAVGNFTIESTIAKNNFSTDDAGKLTVVISGSGNLQLVTAPDIQWPEGVEGFEPKLTDDLLKTTIPVSGKKTMEYTITIPKAGNYILPAVEFSFFDPKTGRYKTVATRPIDITVTKGTGKPRQTDITQNKISTESFLNSFFNNRLRVVSVVAILIILGLLFWLKFENRNNKKSVPVSIAEDEERTNAGPDERQLLRQQNPLAAVEEYLQQNDGQRFYTTLNQSLKQFLTDRFNIKPEELNKKTISEQMDKGGINIETCLQLQKLMDEIEWQLYTPIADNEQMQQIYIRANELVQLINTYKV